MHTERLLEMRVCVASGKVQFLLLNFQQILFYLLFTIIFRTTFLFTLGCMPNITRNAIVNCAELVTYDMIKELILKYDLMTGGAKTADFSPFSHTFKDICQALFPFSFPLDNLPCHFTAAFGAGFCTTVVASPVDVVKTRFMNSRSGQYSSAINCALTMLRHEGPTAFYKG